MVCFLVPLSSSSISDLVLLVKSIRSPLDTVVISWLLIGKRPKNWRDKWLWVKQDRVVHGYYRTINFSDVTLKLFPHNQATADLLKTIEVVPEEYSVVLHFGIGISTSWRLHRKMPIFYTCIDMKWVFLFSFYPLLFIKRKTRSGNRYHFPYKLFFVWF